MFVGAISVFSVAVAQKEVPVISDSPLISVIVCTRNRHAILARALESVLAQDLKRFEVIVVDDGSDLTVQLPASHRDRVRLIRTEHRGVGSARSQGLNVARGQFIAYCDDDDEWEPNHLSILVKYLLEHPDVDLVYADSAWVQEGVTPSVAYSFDYDSALLSEANYIFAGDVVHRASAAGKVGGFDPALQAYEDWDLWLRMSEMCAPRHLPVVLGSHRWHEACVSAHEHWQDWERVFWKHHMQSPPRVVPFDRATWREGRKELIWYSPLFSNNSFGHVSRQLLSALERHGVHITMAARSPQVLPQGYKRFFGPLEDWGRLGFYYDHLRRPSLLKCERVIAYSMWESTLVPKEQIEDINRAAALLYVPCRQNAESFRESGVRIPIKVLHHGVDPMQFPYLTRSRGDFFTFGTFGDLSPRKGIDVLIRAFRDEFSPEDPARLLIKSTAPIEVPAIEEPRLNVLSGFVDQAALLEFLREIDAFVLPSRGEGFGLCALEAMSTGLPVIATNWSGPVEYLGCDFSLPLAYRLVDAGGTEAHKIHFFGMWAEPDYEHLRYLLRWVYDHPEEAAQRGRIASERVHKEWTWDRPARQMIDDFGAIASE